MAAMAMPFPNNSLQNLTNIRLMKQTKRKRTEWVGVQYLPSPFSISAKVTKPCQTMPRIAAIKDDGITKKVHVCFRNVVILSRFDLISVIRLKKNMDQNKRE